MIQVEHGSRYYNRVETGHGLSEQGEPVSPYQQFIPRIPTSSRLDQYIYPREIPEFHPRCRSWTWVLYPLIERYSYSAIDNQRTSYDIIPCIWQTARTSLKTPLVDHVIPPGTKKLRYGASELRKELKSVKRKLKSDGFSPILLDEYIEKHLAMLSREFESPAEIADLGASLRWKKLALSLRYEKNPETLHKMGVKGCGHIYYATALVSFLKFFAKFRHFDSQLKTTEEVDVFLAVSAKLQSLLKSYLKISAMINALKLLPSPEETDFASLVERFIHDDLLKEFGSNKELLLPLGWLLPAPYGGHLILCKISHPSTSSKKLEQCKIQFFNPTLNEGDELLSSLILGREVYSVHKLATSFTFTRDEAPSTVLKDVYKILPLQLPENLAHRMELDKNPEKGEKGGFEKKSKKLSYTVSKINYAVLGQGATELPIDEKSPLDHMEYALGKNCVPSAFRMLLYTMVKEEAAKIGINPLEQQRLKDLCDLFLNHFRDYSTVSLMS